MNLDLDLQEDHWLDEFEKRFRPDGASLDEVLLSDEEPETDFWNDTQWFSGGGEVRTVEQVAERSEETYEEQTPGSSAGFQAAEAATMDRWYAKFDNGEIPTTALDSIGSGHYLRADAADSFRAMRRAAKKDGVNFGITDSYRDLPTQQRLAKEKGLYSQGGLAAVPGTSEHGWGLATDLDLSPEAQAWFAKNARKFGYHSIPREPWHWEYRGGGSYTPKRNANKRPFGKRVKKTVEAKELDPRQIGDASLPVNQSLTGVFLTMFEDDDPVSVRTVRGKQEVETRGTKALKQAPAKLRPFFQRAAEATGLPVGLLIAVAQRESGFNPKAVSSAGAQGVMQIMPLHGLEDPFNARKNIMKGAQILSSYIGGLGIRKGLAAYNAGPSNFQAGLSYADLVLETWRG